MPKAKTGSFITEIPLKVDSHQEREIEARFQAARQLYNACLSEAALSQTHLTGERIKKSLSERVHNDNAGFAMHRDLFSAFLSRYVNQDTQSKAGCSNRVSEAGASLIRGMGSIQTNCENL